MQALTDEASSVVSDDSSVPSIRDLSPATLKTISVKGDIPSPRSNFSLTKFTTNQIFLFGGCDDKQDLNDAYILDLAQLKWTKIDVPVKNPLVGHCSVCLTRSLNTDRPYIYIFGGWDGSGYSDKGILINPKTLDILSSNYNDPVIDWSSNSNSRVTRPHSATSETSGLSKSSASFLTPLTPKKNMSGFPMAAAALTASKEPIMTSQSMAVSAVTTGQISYSKRVTWFASVRSEKAKNDSSFKKMFVEKVPFSRRDHTLTVDPEAQKVFLYGGWNSFHWTFDESKFIEMWTLDSNWRWTKEVLKGTIPQARRGHTTVCLDKQRTLIVYGGCSGYNAILDDCFEYDIQTSTFTKIEGHGIIPEGRAWHSASLIGQWIYYYGGLKQDFKATSEIISFDTVKYEWHTLKYTQSEDIKDLERYGHRVVTINDSILVFGGSTFEPDLGEDAEGAPDGESLKEKKISFDSILILETDEASTIEKTLKVLAREEEKANLDQPELPTDPYRRATTNLRPPPVPADFLDPKKLLRDQSNFLHWNPHIFPNEANKLKIQHFKQKAEEEARKRTENTFAEIEGLEDEEFVSPGPSRRNA